MLDAVAAVGARSSVDGTPGHSQLKCRTPPSSSRPIPVRDGGGHVVGHGVHSFQQHRASAGCQQAIRSRVRTGPLKAAFVGATLSCCAAVIPCSYRCEGPVVTSIRRARYCKRSRLTVVVILLHVSLRAGQTP